MTRARTRIAADEQQRSERPSGDAAEKICARCGRAFQWRAKWARDWASVTHCSERCRRTRPGSIDLSVEREILALLDARGAGKTICPSEVARALFPDDWRAQMERVRAAARRLVARGELVVRQRGQIVDPSRARGAIRLGRP